MPTSSPATILISLSSLPQDPSSSSFSNSNPNSTLPSSPTSPTSDSSFTTIQTPTHFLTQPQTQTPPQIPTLTPTSIPFRRLFHSFASPSSDPYADLTRVIDRLRSAKKIVVICGAGISTSAQIPDFRSADGLFNSGGLLDISSSSARLGSEGGRAGGDDGSGASSDVENVSVSGTLTAKGDVGERKVSKKSKSRKQSSVLDLFHVKCLTSHTLLPAHHALLNDLWDRSQVAQPTSFHKFLAKIDTEGRLVRCYTQNIDTLEAKVGLSVGIPPKRSRARLRKVQLQPNALELQSQPQPPQRLPSPTSTFPTLPPSQTLPISELASSSQPISTSRPLVASQTLSLPLSQPLSPQSFPSPSSLDLNTSKFTPDPILDPACIPLHGQLSSLVCRICSSSYPISDFLPLPPAPIACPSCAETSEIRSALRERQRRQGQLRADVVLYGEEHPLGELIGAAVERDLRGRTNRIGGGKVDLLVVAGTTLSIPGVKRIVRELAKSLRKPPRTNSEETDSDSDIEEKEEQEEKVEVEVKASFNSKTEDEVVQNMTQLQRQRPCQRVKQPSQRRRQRQSHQPQPFRTIFINNEPPARPGEWDGVFDVWVEGNVEQLISLVEDPQFVVDPKIISTRGKTKSVTTSTTNTNSVKAASPMPIEISPTTTPKRKQAVSHPGLPTPESMVKRPKTEPKQPRQRKETSEKSATEPKQPRKRKPKIISEPESERDSSNGFPAGLITPLRRPKSSILPSPRPTPPSPSVRPPPLKPIPAPLSNDDESEGYGASPVPPPRLRSKTLLRDSSTLLYSRDKMAAPSSPIISRSSSPLSPSPLSRAATVSESIFDDLL